MCSLNSEQQEQKQGHTQFITEVAMASLLRLVKVVSTSMVGEWSFVLMVLTLRTLGIDL